MIYGSCKGGLQLNQHPCGNRHASWKWKPAPWRPSLQPCFRLSWKVVVDATEIWGVMESEFPWRSLKHGAESSWIIRLSDVAKAALKFTPSCCNGIKWPGDDESAKLKGRLCVTCGCKRSLLSFPQTSLLKMSLYQSSSSYWCVAGNERMGLLRMVRMVVRDHSQIPDLSLPRTARAWADNSSAFAG